MQTFEQWWNELEGYGLRAERFTNPGDAAKAAWDQAMSLRAQADARPVAEQWKTWVHEWMGEHDVILPTQAYTELLGTHPETSAPGLSEEALDTSLLWYLNHELGRALSEAKSPKLSRLHVTTLMELVNRALTRASAATTCVACGGSPSAENNPCAVCGSAATVAEPGADEQAAFETWMRANRYDVGAFASGGYHNMFARNAWMGWQARAAQQRAEPGADGIHTMYVWLAHEKGDATDRFIRAWTSDPANVAALQATIGEPPVVYRAAQSGQRAGLAEDEPPITRDAFYRALRAALKRYRQANPSRYLNDDQVDADDSEFVSDLADKHAEIAAPTQQQEGGS